MVAGGRHVISLGTLLLAGCVPTGAPRVSSADIIKSSTRPRIEPLIDGLIDETPIWDAKPVTAEPILVSRTRYVVKPGDGLYAVGEATGAGSDAIARANGLTPPYRIKPGQTLRIPPGRYHRVGVGETGIAIARAYGVPWGTFVKANALNEPFVLRIGQRLLVPGTTVASPEARAASFKIDIDDLATGAVPARTMSEPQTASVASLAIGRFSWPLTGTVVERFGRFGRGRVNRGIEIAGQAGDEIRAAADGTVAFVGNSGSAGYGGVILIRHGDGWMSVYGRAGHAAVARDQAVKAGQAIGAIGEDARLHFELRRHRSAVDPTKYLASR